MIRIGTLLAGLLLSNSMVAEAATVTRIKIGGSGPIDRPTVLTNFWCYGAWNCQTHDTFTADGTTALVRLTVRNWNQFDPSEPMSYRLDNFFVVEQPEHDANMRAVGNLANTTHFCADGPTDVALDIQALDPRNVVFADQFVSEIGSQWVGDPNQISYVSTGAEDDPFNPDTQRTGSMAIGNGTGPEFVTVELELTGLFPGTTYVISYWNRSSSDWDDINFAWCDADDDDFEIEIFGEQGMCAPDPPDFSLHDIRTLAFDPSTNLWSFQLILDNYGSGPANGLRLFLDDVEGPAIVVDGTAEFGDVPVTVPAGIPPAYGETFTVDITGIGAQEFTNYQLTFDFDNDCGVNEVYPMAFLGLLGPVLNTTPAPSAMQSLLLHQNEPNPFNPRTTISFELGQAGLVRLLIYDARGRLTRQLVEDVYPAGKHDVIWDGRDDAGATAGGGVYFYRLHTTDGERVRKMILMK